LVVNAVVLAEIAPRFSRIEALEASLPSRSIVESCRERRPSSHAELRK
jgi:hypothetical protein